MKPALAPISYTTGLSSPCSQAAQELRLGLVGAAKVERKVGEIAGVTDEIVTEPTGGDEPRDPDGLRAFSHANRIAPLIRGTSVAAATDTSPALPHITWMPWVTT